MMDSSMTPGPERTASPERTAADPERTASPERTVAADEHLDRVLLAMAGPEARPREDQRIAVRALVADRARVLVVQATGWGKSAVYWAATSAIRALGGGPTLVVSPLLALMRDQVAAAGGAGLVAATINSTNTDEWDQVMAELEAGRTDVLLVSPERLGNPRFASRLGPLLAGAGLIVIDEAHCISDWGFDFRPDYQRLSALLLTQARTPVLATTATANARVTTDVAEQLGDQTVVLRGGLARSSLTLSVLPGLGAYERYAWVDEALGRLEGSGIIYVPVVAETARLAGYLVERGHRVAAYSGQLDAAVRARLEDQLRDNQVKALVATSALGMGYDKPDLGFCLHVGSPDSPVAYYQQVGRAGRAIEHAEAVLLPAETDERIWRHFATASVPDPGAVRQLLDVLGPAEAPQSVPTLESSTGLRRGRLESMLKILAVEGVVARQGSGWVATGEPYLHDTAKWEGIVAAREAEAELMRAYAAGRGCLMRFLQLALDDPSPEACGRCSVCTGRGPAGGLEVSEESAAAARRYLRGADVVLEPRKQWPRGLRDGRKSTIRGAAPGRALAYADLPGWQEAARAVAGPDRALEEELVRGLVEVLGRWRTSWGTRPVAVVPMPSRHHPTLIHQLAEQLGTIGSLPVVELLTVTGPAPPDGVPSLLRVEALIDGLALLDGVAIPDGPVLLVDDTYRSGWTMTVAASLLRDVGVPAVLPLVVHQQP